MARRRRLRRGQRQYILATARYRLDHVRWRLEKVASELRGLGDEHAAALAARSAQRLAVCRDELATRSGRR